MSLPERALGLRLHGVPIATLLQRASQGDRPVYELHFEESYINALNRPVLSLKCRDWRIERPRRFHKRMPAFLTNLIPEAQGALRRRIARAAAFDESDEFTLLEFVGQDLSGAISVEQTDARPASSRSAVDEHERPALDPLTQRLRLSGGLGGVQLKFSVDREDRITLPVHGRRGRWILKIPDHRHESLVRAELAMLLWAAEVGFEVPDLDVVDPREVDGLPPDALGNSEEALLVRRFDRLEDYRPVHMEEMNSIMGFHPEEKYPEDAPNPFTLVTVARIVREFTGKQGLRTFLERIIFDVIAGNGDAHLKNWAFVFADGRQATFAPAYDIVPTILYGYDPRLAIPFVHDAAFRSVDVRRIKLFAKELKEDPDEFVHLAGSVVDRAKETFHRAMERAQLPGHLVRVLERHWTELPLIQEH